MIKINKDVSIQTTPTSLKPAFKENFIISNIGRTSRTTTLRRHELIRLGAYSDLKKFNRRYKLDDIKRELKKIYLNKCAYCEQRVEQFHVEHYRPKQIYYWLAFSWDNLLCCCDDCNQTKSTHFHINGTQVSFTSSIRNLKQINTLSASYNIQEKPSLINPEVDNPEGELIFNKVGKVTSVNPRFLYTIEKCGIDRKYLNDNRKKILDDLLADLKEELVQSRSKEMQMTAINTILKKFMRDAQNSFNEYLAFRRYVIDKWLKEEIKRILN